MNIVRYRNSSRVSISYKYRVTKESYLVGDFQVNINGGVTMNANTLQRHCTPGESLKEALKEMKLIREGKAEKQSFWDMLKELDDEEDE